MKCCSVTWWERRLLPAADWCADCTGPTCTACSSPVCARHSAPVKCVATLGFMCGAAEEEEEERGGEADGRLDCTGVCSAGGVAMPRLRPAEKSRLASRVQKAHSVHSLVLCWNCTTGTQAQCIALEALCDRLLL